MRGLTDDERQVMIGAMAATENELPESLLDASYALLARGCLARSQLRDPDCFCGTCVIDRWDATAHGRRVFELDTLARTGIM
jgi:hypothetical protein